MFQMQAQWRTTPAGVWEALDAGDIHAVISTPLGCRSQRTWGTKGKVKALMYSSEDRIRSTGLEVWGRDWGEKVEGAPHPLQL